MVKILFKWLFSYLVLVLDFDAFVLLMCVLVSSENRFMCYVNFMNPNMIVVLHAVCGHSP